MHFYVLPAEHKAFLDAFVQAQDLIKQEEHLQMHALRKVANNNYEYVLAASWVSMDDFFEHMK